VFIRVHPWFLLLGEESDERAARPYRLTKGASRGTFALKNTGGPPVPPFEACQTRQIRGSAFASMVGLVGLDRPTLAV
jgi:hypothetical protein